MIIHEKNERPWIGPFSDSLASESLASDTPPRPMCENDTLL